MKKRVMALFCALQIAISLIGGCGAEKIGDADRGENRNMERADSLAGDAGGTDYSSADTVIVAMGTSSEPAAGFDPCISWGCGEHCHEPLIQSTLIRTTVDMGFENDLATAYNVSEDGMTWTFTLRDDVRFTDGEALTASDVAFTFRTALATENSEADLSMLEDVEAIDDVTVMFHLSKPYNAFLYTLAVFGIVPEHCYDRADYGENPVGSGRYIMTQWDRGQQVIFEANPDYYGEEVQIKRVIVLFMEEDAALAAAKAGQVDVAYTSAIYSEEMIEGYSLFVCKSVDSRGISLPILPSGNEVKAGELTYAAGNDLTSDKAIRQAMNYALDRQTMIDHVLNGYGEVAYSVSDHMPWSSEDMVVSYDPQKARQILKDGGWSDTDGDGILEKEGRKAEFTVYYSASDSVRQALTAEFSNQMKAVGIHVLYEGLGSWDELYAKMYSDPILWGWGSNSPIENYQLYYTNGACNFTGYSNEETDACLDAALAANDMEQSYKLWQQAQKEAASDEEALWVWFANVDHLYFVRDGLNVAEQKLHPHGHGWSVVNNVDQWNWE